MSRTDKTRPFWVRKEDHKIVRPRLQPDDRYLEYYTYKWWLGEMRCGCPLCQDTAGRKQETRTKRRKGREETRNWWRE